VDGINKNLEAKQIKIHLQTDAAKYILEKTCADRSYGARPLRRALQKYIEDPLSEALIQGALPRPSELEVYLSDTGIFYRQINIPVDVPVIAGEVGPDDAVVETTTGPGVLLYNF
jgi:ATP-dependent Clp protease ATP-binding subunit ClpC